MLIDPIYNIFSISFIILKEDFCSREKTYLTIFFARNIFIIREDIEYFQVNIKRNISI